jgi:hypothetical protein
MPTTFNDEYEDPGILEIVTVVTEDVTVVEEMRIVPGLLDGEFCHPRPDAVDEYAVRICPDVPGLTAILDVPSEDIICPKDDVGFGFG